MKFNEYDALRKHLEENGSSIDEFVKNVTGKHLNEEGEGELDTKGDKLKRITSPRFAKARRKLTNNAKQFLKSSKEKILNKWLPQNLKVLKDVANKAAIMAKDKKNPQEIVQALQGEAKKIAGMQLKAEAQLEKAIDQLELTYQKRIDSIMKSDKLSEKSKIKLNIYWTLLLTQVRQLIFKQIISERNKFIDETAAENKDLQKIINKLTNAEHYNAKIAEIQKDADKQKKDYQKASAEARGDEEEEREFKTLDQYQYTSKKGIVHEIIIKEVKEDGDIVVASVKKPDVIYPAIKKGSAAMKRIGKKTKEASTL